MLVLPSGYSSMSLLTPKHATVLACRLVQGQQMLSMVKSAYVYSNSRTDVHSHVRYATHLRSLFEAELESNANAVNGIVTGFWSIHSKHNVPLGGLLLPSPVNVPLALDLIRA